LTDQRTFRTTNPSLEYYDPRVDVGQRRDTHTNYNDIHFLTNRNDIQTQAHCQMSQNPSTASNTGQLNQDTREVRNGAHMRNTNDRPNVSTEFMEILADLGFISNDLTRKIIINKKQHNSFRIKTTILRIQIFSGTCKTSNMQQAIQVSTGPRGH
jgi:hypothetical protein